MNEVWSQTFSFVALGKSTVANCHSWLLHLYKRELLLLVEEQRLQPEPRLRICFSSINPSKVSTQAILCCEQLFRAVEDIKQDPGCYPLNSLFCNFRRLGDGLCEHRRHPEVCPCCCAATANPCARGGLRVERSTSGVERFRAVLGLNSRVFQRVMTTVHLPANRCDC